MAPFSVSIFSLISRLPGTTPMRAGVSSRTAPAPDSLITSASMTDTISTSLIHTIEPRPVQRFIFGVVPALVTCTSATVNWTYSGPAQPFSFLVSSSITPHTNLPGLDNAKRAVIELPIASNLQTIDETWTWPSVNIGEGWYELQAVGQGFRWMVSSPQFFVRNGTDVSCLIGRTSSSSANTISSTHATQSSPSSVSSPEVSNVTHLNAGTIGGIIGGILGLAVLLLAVALLFCRGRGRARVSLRALSSNKTTTRSDRKWDPLSSRISAVKSVTDTDEPPPPHRIAEPAADTNSMGGMPRRRSLEPNRRPRSSLMLTSSGSDAAPWGGTPAAAVLAKLDTDVEPLTPHARSGKPAQSIDTPISDAPSSSAWFRNSRPQSYSSFRWRASEVPSQDSPVPSSATSRMYYTSDIP